MPGKATLAFRLYCSLAASPKPISEFTLLNNTDLLTALHEAGAHLEADLFDALSEDSKRWVRDVVLHMEPFDLKEVDLTGKVDFDEFWSFPTDEAARSFASGLPATVDKAVRNNLVGFRGVLDQPIEQRAIKAGGQLSSYLEWHSAVNVQDTPARPMEADMNFPARLCARYDPRDVRTLAAEYPADHVMPQRENFAKFVEALGAIEPHDDFDPVLERFVKVAWPSELMDNLKAAIPSTGLNFEDLREQVSFVARHLPRTLLSLNPSDLSSHLGEHLAHELVEFIHWAFPGVSEEDPDPEGDADADGEQEADAEGDAEKAKMGESVQIEPNYALVYVSGRDDVAKLVGPAMASKEMKNWTDVDGLSNWLMYGHRIRNVGVMRPKDLGGYAIYIPKNQLSDLKMVFGELGIAESSVRVVTADDAASVAEGGVRDTLGRWYRVIKEELYNTLMVSEAEYALAWLAHKAGFRPEPSLGEFGLSSQQAATSRRAAERMHDKYPGFAGESAGAVKRLAKVRAPALQEYKPRKGKHTPKQRKHGGGNYVFPPTEKDPYGRYPMTNAAQARNALARAGACDEQSSWMKIRGISCADLKKKVANAAKKDFPSIEVGERVGEAFLDKNWVSYLIPVGETPALHKQLRAINNSQIVPKLAKKAHIRPDMIFGVETPVGFRIFVYSGNKGGVLDILQQAGIMDAYEGPCSPPVQEAYPEGDTPLTFLFRGVSADHAREWAEEWQGLGYITSFNVSSSGNDTTVSMMAGNPGQVRIAGLMLGNYIEPDDPAYGTPSEGVEESRSSALTAVTNYAGVISRTDGEGYADFAHAMADHYLSGAALPDPKLWARKYGDFDPIWADLVGEKVREILSQHGINVRESVSEAVMKSIAYIDLDKKEADRLREAYDKANPWDPSWGEQYTMESDIVDLLNKNGRFGDMRAEYGKGSDRYAMRLWVDPSHVRQLSRLLSAAYGLRVKESTALVFDSEAVLQSIAEGVFEHLNRPVSVSVDAIGGGILRGFVEPTAALELFAEALTHLGEGTEVEIDKNESIFRAKGLPEGLGWDTPGDLYPADGPEALGEDSLFAPTKVKPSGETDNPSNRAAASAKKVMSKNGPKKMAKDPKEVGRGEKGDKAGGKKPKTIPRDASGGPGTSGESDPSADYTKATVGVKGSLFTVLGKKKGEKGPQAKGGEAKGKVVTPGVAIKSFECTCPHCSNSVKENVLKRFAPALLEQDPVAGGGATAVSPANDRPGNIEAPPGAASTPPKSEPAKEPEKPTEADPTKRQDDEEEGGPTQGLVCPFCGKEIPRDVLKGMMGELLAQLAAQLQQGSTKPEEPEEEKPEDEEEEEEETPEEEPAPEPEPEQQPAQAPAGETPPAAPMAPAAPGKPKESIEERGRTDFVQQFMGFDITYYNARQGFEANSAEELQDAIEARYPGSFRGYVLDAVRSLIVKVPVKQADKFDQMLRQQLLKVKSPSVISSSVQTKDGEPVVETEQEPGEPVIEAGGSGMGRFRQGAPVRGTDSLSVGDLLVNVSKQFGAVNVARVTDVGGIGGVVTAIFVDPNNPSKKRMPSDREFAIHDFDTSDYFFAEGVESEEPIAVGEIGVDNDGIPAGVRVRVLDSHRGKAKVDAGGRVIDVAAEDVLVYPSGSTIEECLAALERGESLGAVAMRRLTSRTKAVRLAALGETTEGSSGKYLSMYFPNVEACHKAKAAVGALGSKITDGTEVSFAVEPLNGESTRLRTIAEQLGGAVLRTITPPGPVAEQLDIDTDSTDLGEVNNLFQGALADIKGARDLLIKAQTGDMARAVALLKSMGAKEKVMNALQGVADSIEEHGTNLKETLGALDKAHDVFSKAYPDAPNGAPEEEPAPENGEMPPAEEPAPENGNGEPMPVEEPPVEAPPAEEQPPPAVSPRPVESMNKILGEMRRSAHWPLIRYALSEDDFQTFGNFMRSISPKITAHEVSAVFETIQEVTEMDMALESGIVHGAHFLAKSDVEMPGEITGPTMAGQEKPRLIGGQTVRVKGVYFGEDGKLRVNLDEPIEMTVYADDMMTAIQSGQLVAD